jgi:hypothetical protein
MGPMRRTAAPLYSRSAPQNPEVAAPDERRVAGRISGTDLLVCVRDTAGRRLAACRLNWQFTRECRLTARPEG